MPVECVNFFCQLHPNMRGNGAKSGPLNKAQQEALAAMLSVDQREQAVQSTFSKQFNELRNRQTLTEEGDP